MSPAMNQLDNGWMNHSLRARRAGNAFDVPGVLVAAGALLTVLALGGCAKPLLSPDEERSPFDRYDGIRAQYAPQYTTDEYGLRKPNLRNRLGNKN